jgi:hypothetical protein
MKTTTLTSNSILPGQEGLGVDNQNGNDADSDRKTSSEDTNYAPGEVLEDSRQNTRQPAATSAGFKQNFPYLICRKTFSTKFNTNQHI